MTAQLQKHSFSDAFILSVRVYYEDTDAGGIVYHANYLKFTERARTEWLRSLGYDHHKVRSEFNLLLVVRHAKIDFRAPARLDDLLDIKTQVTAVGNASLALHQTILNKGKVLAEVKTAIVAVSPHGNARRLPPQLRQIFSSQKTA